MGKHITCLFGTISWCGRDVGCAPPHLVTEGLRVFLPVDPPCDSPPSRNPMTEPIPFKVNISDDLLELTKKKLELSRLPDQLLNVNWEGCSIIMLFNPFGWMELQSPRSNDYGTIGSTITTGENTKLQLINFLNSLCLLSWTILVK